MRRRNYKRDRLGRFARTNSKGSKKGTGKRYARIGGVLGGALMIGGPAYIPAGVAVGYASGRAIDSALARSRR